MTKQCKDCQTEFTYRDKSRIRCAPCEDQYSADLMAVLRASIDAAKQKKAERSQEFRERLLRASRADWRTYESM